jgi:hypothetical protein
MDSWLEIAPSQQAFGLAVSILPICGGTTATFAVVSNDDIGSIDPSGTGEADQLLGSSPAMPSASVPTLTRKDPHPLRQL